MEVALGNGPAGMAAGSDGNMWFTEPGASKIGRIMLASSPLDNLRLDVFWGPKDARTLASDNTGTLISVTTKWTRPPARPQRSVEQARFPRR